MEQAVKTIPLLLLGLLLLGLVSGGSPSCTEYVALVLQNNEPIVISSVPIPGRKVRVTLAWEHVHDLLRQQPDCHDRLFSAYMIEYAPYSFERVKRESVSSNSIITPGLNATQHAITIPDDCRVYSAHLVLAASDHQLMYSSPHRFWSAAHHVKVEMFSESAIISWKAKCATNGWRIRAECNDEHCPMATTPPKEVHLRESPSHLDGLASCTSYQFQLLPDDKVLWSVRGQTLPKPTLNISAGRSKLTLRIMQTSCSNPASQIKFWRVTYCRVENEASFRAKEALNDEGGSGSGDGSEFYYYDEETSIESCSQVVHDASTVLTLGHLDHCTLYSIDVTPTTPDGDLVQPAEQYGLIQSTLCGSERNDDNVVEAGQDSGFWFDEEKDPATGPAVTNYDTSGLFLALLIVGALLAIITVVSIIAIVRRTRKKPCNRTSTDEIKKDESSSKLALLAK